MAKKLYIIDGHAHNYAAYCAPMRQCLTSPTGEPAKAGHIFTTPLLSFLRCKNSDMPAIATNKKSKLSVKYERTYLRPFAIPTGQNQADRFNVDCGFRTPNSALGQHSG
jgi:hypothetical protein